MPDKLGRSERLPKPDSSNLDPQYLSGFYRLSVWYALLYVVVEAYQELKLHDDKIDKELQRTDFVSALRRARNATFHFQDDFFTEKFWNFYLMPDGGIWVQNLHREFDRFFTETVVAAAKARGLKL